MRKRRDVVTIQRNVAILPDVVDLAHEDEIIIIPEKQ